MTCHSKQALLMVLAFLALAVLTGHRLFRQWIATIALPRPVARWSRVATLSRRFQDELRAKAGRNILAAIGLGGAQWALMISHLPAAKPAGDAAYDHRHLSWAGTLQAATGVACRGGLRRLLLVFAEAHLAKTDWY